MESLTNYKQYKILYIDDEILALKYFRKTFEEQFTIFTASSTQEGWNIIQECEQEIGIIITDQVMPGEKGVDFLERVRRAHPQIVRILITAYADLESAIQAVNSGQIYKYVTKPWDFNHLSMTLKRSLDFFSIQQERDSLLKEKISSLHYIMLTDRILSLGLFSLVCNPYILHATRAIQTFLQFNPNELVENDPPPNNIFYSSQFWNNYYQTIQTKMHRVMDILNPFWPVIPSKPPVFQNTLSLEALLNSSIQKFKTDLNKKSIRVDNLISKDLPPLPVDQNRFDSFFEFLLKEALQISDQPLSIQLTSLSFDPTLSTQQVQIEVLFNGLNLFQEAWLAILNPSLNLPTMPNDQGAYLLSFLLILYHHSGFLTVISPSSKSILKFVISLSLHPDSHSSLIEESDLSNFLINHPLTEKLMLKNF
jgi:CheY-like chemotaxis protein